MSKKVRTIEEINAEKAKLQAEEAAIAAPICAELSTLVNGETFDSLMEQVSAAAQALPDGAEKTHATNWVTVTGHLQNALKRAVAQNQ